MFYRTFDT